MVGGTTPSRVIQVRFPESCPQPSLAKQAVLTHRPGYFCLDNAFALIEGQPRQKADSSPLKRIRNDKYLKPGSRRGAPRNDKYVSERGGETLGVSLGCACGTIRT